MKPLHALKVGDEVVRMLSGTIPMTLKVTEVTPERIVCGWWEFDIENGAEIDEELGWNRHMTGSFIRATE